MKNTVDYLDIGAKTHEGRLTIHIEVDKNLLSLIDRQTEEIIKSYPIASGKPESPTPLGSFKIIEKAKWGEGFGSNWLGLNVPWGIYGIHGTNRPESIGRNISAGCVRMQNKHIEELYHLINEETNVVITKGPYGPFGLDFRILKPGDRGADVLEVQKRLGQKGYFKSKADGIYGELMKEALINFQKDRGMELTDRVTEEIYKELGILLME